MFHIYKINIHGKDNFFGVKEVNIYPEGKKYTIKNFFIVEHNKKKKQLEFIPTIVSYRRAAKAKKLSTLEVIELLNKKSIKG